jgi:hypothetical protein
MNHDPVHDIVRTPVAAEHECDECLTFAGIDDRGRHRRTAVTERVEHEALRAESGHARDS